MAIELFVNKELSDLDTGGQTSTVGEPSICNNGNQILMTGNWYASRSLDHGKTWAYMSPFNSFPMTDGGFCCDQTVLYDLSRDITIWLLQYVKANGTNTLRLAVKSGPNLGNDFWQWWDLTPSGIDSKWHDEWFDYNHASLSDNFLYVGTNVFSSDQDSFTRCIIFRMSLDELVAGELGLDYFETQNFSLRCVQGARDVMYMASHNSNSQVRIFAWPEGEDGITQTDVDVSFWAGGISSAPGPDNSNWLARSDGRITGAWHASGTLGFMWNANRLGTARPRPYVRVITLDTANMALLTEPDIWNSETAYAYPTAAPNDRGHVGISLFRGGGNLNPGHVIGIMDDMSDGWELRETRQGSHGPVDQKWGDYLACVRHSPDGLTWLASGFTLQGGSDASFVEPRIVHFGRSRFKQAVVRWGNA